MLATDVMRTWFATVKPNAPLLDAVHLLLETNQRGLPVIDDNGSLIGVISEGDFLHRRELGVTCPAGFLLEWLLGREKGQLVCERMRALRVDEVVGRMDDHQISQVLVVRNGRLVGIVGRMQLLAALERCLSRQSR
jgi:CBS domain-containing protein